MNKPSPGTRARVLSVVGALVLSVAPALSSAALAHPARYRHRHPHGAHVVVVSRPVSLAHAVIIGGVAHGAIDLAVQPATTEVHVDGSLRGKADQFDGHPDKLYLRPGVHQIALITPDGEKHMRKVRIVAGQELNIKLDATGN